MNYDRLSGVVEKGDHLDVYTTEGKLYILRVKSIEPELMTGTSNGDLLRIPYSSVDQVIVGTDKLRNSDQVAIGLGIAAAVGLTFYAIIAHGF